MYLIKLRSLPWAKKLYFSIARIHKRLVKDKLKVNSLNKPKYIEFRWDNERLLEKNRKRCNSNKLGFWVYL